MSPASPTAHAASEAPAGEKGSSPMERAERLALALVLAFPFFGFFRGFRLWVGDSLALYALVSLGWLGLWLWRMRRRTHPLPRPSWWDVSLVGCGAWMAVATAVGTAETGIGRVEALLFWAWGLGILLALYAARRYGRTYGPGFLARFATVILATEGLVCLAQYQALAGDTVAASFLARVMNVEGASELFTVGGGGVRVTRAIGTFYHANAVGACIVLLLPFAVHRVRSAWDARASFEALVSLALVLLSLLVLVRNLSRASMAVGLAVLVAGLALEVLHPRRRRRPATRRWTLAVGALLLAAGGAWVARDLVRGDDFARVARAKVADRDTAGVRLGLFRSAMAALPQRPLLGFGYGLGRRGMPGLVEVAGEVSASASTRYQGAGMRQAPAHNLYLMLAMDGGLPALLCFLAAAGSVALAAVKRLRHLPPADASLALSVLAGLVLGMAEPLVYDLFWPFFLFAIGSLRAAVSR